MKFAAGLVPALPVVFQKPALEMPSSAAAFTSVTLAPLPLNVPLMLPPLVATLAGNCVAEMLPVTLPAVTAYGEAVNGCRGASVVNAPLPLVRTPISSQRAAPGN